jgi:3-dehydroquinate dehydratase-2
MIVLVIHGPNLNLLGRRELAVYGPATLEEVDARIREVATELGIEVEIHQTAREGEIIELLHSGADRVAGALLNPAAYSHTSRAIADAIRAVGYPVVEVHLSNIHAREPWRRRSVTAEAARGIVAGFGPDSYAVGLRALKAIAEGD